MAKRSGSKKGTIEDIVISVKATNIDKVTTSLSSLKTILSSVQTSITNINPRLATMGKNMEEVAGKIVYLGTVSETYHKQLLKTANGLNKLTTNLNALGSAANGSAAAGMEKVFGAMGNIVAADVAAGLSALNNKANATNAALDALLETGEQTNKYLYVMAANLESVADASEDTTAGITRLKDALDKGTKSTKKAQDAVSGLGRTHGNTSRSLSKASFSIAGPVVAAYAAWAATIYTVVQAFDFLKRSSDLTRLEQNLGALAIRGQDLRALASNIEEVSAGALSYEESIRTATKAVTYGFSSEELERLTIGARKASIALGRDMTESLDRLTLGIAKGEIELLDELGIVTRLDTAFEKYAATVGKTKEQLTETERQTALTVESLNQLEAAYGGINIQATVYDNLLANTKTLARNLGQGLASNVLVEGMAKGLNSAAEAINNMSENQSKYNRRLKIAVDLQEAFSNFMNRSQTREGFTQSDSALNALGKYITAAKEQEAAENDLQKALAKRAELQKKVDAIRAQAAKDPNSLRGYSGIDVVELSQINQEISKLEENIVKLNKGNSLLNFSNFDKLKQIFPELSGMGGDLNEITKLFEDFTKRNAAARDSNGKFNEEFSKTMVGTVNIYHGLYSELESMYSSLDGLDGKFSTLNSDVSNSFLEIAKSMDLEEAFARAGNNPRWLIDHVKEQGDLITSLSRRVSLFNNEVATSLSSPAEQARLRAEGYRKLAEDITLVNDVTRQQYMDQVTLNESEARSAEITESREASLSKLNTQFEIKQAYEKDEVRSLKLQIEAAERAIQLQKDQGASIAYLRGQLEDLKVLRNELVVTESLRAEQMEMSKLNAMYAAKAIFIEDSVELAELEIKAQEARVALLKENKADNMEIFEAELELKQLILEGNKAYQDRKRVLQDIALENSKALSDARGAIRGESDVSKRERELQYTREQLSRETDKEERARLEGQIKVLEEELKAARREQASKIGGSDGLTSIFGNESLANVGYQASQGNQEAVNQQAAENLSKIKDELQSINPAMGEVTNGVATLGQTFYQMGELAKGGMLNVQSAAQGVSASIQAVSGILSGLTQQNIDGIETEIAIEKKRDGKSKESMEKIKKLENQKLKEMQKAKLQQAVMATAAGIAESLSLPWPYNFIQAGIVAAMGAAQIAAIRSSGKSEAALLNTEQGGGSMSLTVGKRENSVDVSKSANMGELAYSHGVSGTGTGMGNYTPTPRSSAADMSAGTTYIAGDRGPEVISLNGGGASVRKTNESQPSVSIPIQINASALDASGLETKMKEIIPFMVDSIEERLNGRGYTLYKKT